MGLLRHRAGTSCMFSLEAALSNCTALFQQLREHGTSEPFIQKTSIICRSLYRHTSHGCDRTQEPTTKAGVLRVQDAKFRANWVMQNYAQDRLAHEHCFFIWKHSPVKGTIENSLTPLCPPFRYLSRLMRSPGAFSSPG